LTVEQIERLLKAAEGDQNRQIYPFIRIGLDTSMRKTEILSIRREHIDLQRLVIYIPKAKAGATRATHHRRTSAEYLGWLCRHVRPGDQWLFPSPPPRKGARSIWTSHFAAACWRRAWM
jgi:integrase